MTVCTFAGPLYQRRYDISIPEVMDESKNTFLADQPPVYTIANPKKYRQFKKPHIFSDGSILRQSRM